MCLLVASDDIIRTPILIQYLVVIIDSAIQVVLQGIVVCRACIIVHVYTESNPYGIVWPQTRECLGVSAIP